MRLLLPFVSISGAVRALGAGYRRRSPWCSGHAALCGFVATPIVIVALAARFDGSNSDGEGGTGKREVGYGSTTPFLSLCITTEDYTLRALVAGEPAVEHPRRYCEAPAQHPRATAASFLCVPRANVPPPSRMEGKAYRRADYHCSCPIGKILEVLKGPGAVVHVDETRGTLSNTPHAVTAAPIEELE